MTVFVGPLAARLLPNGMDVPVEKVVVMMEVVSLHVQFQSLATPQTLLGLLVNFLLVRQFDAAMGIVQPVSAMLIALRLGIVLTAHLIVGWMVNATPTQLMVLALQLVVKPKFQRKELLYVHLFVHMYAEMVPVLLMLLIVLQFSLVLPGHYVTT